LSKPLFGQPGWPATAVDYSIIYDASRFIIADHSSPQFFPNPPAAVVLLSVTTLFPAKISFAIWLAVVGLAAAVSYWSIARILGLRLGSGLMPVLPLAQVASSYAIQWDMRSLNTNLVVLAAVLPGFASLVRGREIARGAGSRLPSH
jgi:Glycosyltransferase family 87